MRRMWQIYGIAWLFYSLILSFAIQIQALQQGQLDFAQIGLIYASDIPAALLMTTIWPLTGYLQRSAASTRQLIDYHIAGALLVATICHIWDYEILRILFGNRPRQALYLYLWPFLFKMMMYGVVAGIFHGVRASQAAREQAIVASQTQALLMTAELTALRNKLNPHFLFNTLHSIIALVRKDAVAAEAALFRFSDMLRYLLDTEKSGNDKVMLEDEIGFVRDYLDLEALRLGPRLQVLWEMDPKAAYISLPALSIQPLVENSIKHAFNPRSQPGTLRISCQLDATRAQLCVRISDDGPGADPANLASATGMGVKTVQRRLQLQYQGRAGFEIQTAPGQGFTITLTLPTSSANPGPDQARIDYTDP